ncbi:MAG: hypothetical protein KAH14_09170 [Clostridiales bacterium]|nr:hypothetical protein [Clostridiales bacterium]
MNTKIILILIVIQFAGISLQAEGKDHVHLVDKLAYKLKEILDGKVKDANEWTYYYQFVGPGIKKNAPNIDKLFVPGKNKNYPARYKYGWDFVEFIRYLYMTPEKYSTKPDRKDVKKMVEVLTEYEKNTEKKVNEPDFILFPMGRKFSWFPPLMIVFARKGRPIYILAFYTSDTTLLTAMDYYYYDRIGIMEVKYTQENKILGAEVVLFKTDKKLKQMTESIWKKLNIGMIPKDGFSIGHNNFYFMPMGMMKGLMTPVEYIIERKKSEVATIKENRKTMVLDKIEELKAIKKKNNLLTYKQRKKLKALQDDYKLSCLPYIRKKEEELKKLIEKYKDQLPKKK